MWGIVGLTTNEEHDGIFSREYKLMAGLGNPHLIYKHHLKCGCSADLGQKSQWPQKRPQDL